MLKVISSSPSDLEPVFRTIVENAARLCEAQVVDIVLVEGSVLRIGEPGATYGELGQYPGESIPLDRSTVMGRSVCDRRPIQVEDLQNADEFELGRKLALRFGHRTILAVPLIREDRALGALLVRRNEVRLFDQTHVSLLTSFADQAAIAIENVRLFEAEQQRTRELAESLQQQTATADVLKVISRSTFDLQAVLDTLVESASRLCEGDQANIARPASNGFFQIDATFGLSEAHRADQQKLRFKPERGSLIGRVLLEQGPVQILDAQADSEYTLTEALKIGGFRTMLGVPLMREKMPIGVFGLTRRFVRPFTDKQIELLTTFADQAVIAIENARLLGELRQRTADLSESLEELRTAQDRLVQTEKLASLGQLTAGIAHEIKNPLNFVNNFSAVSVELIDELRVALGCAHLDAKLGAEVAEIANTLQGNLDKVVQHGKRADAIVKNMLLHSRQGSGEHRPVDINALVEESLNLAYHGARAEKQGFEITLERSFDPAAGQADVFPQDITRVLLNLISNGFYAATKRKAEANGRGYEPMLAAATKDLGDRVEIRIRDNGTGIPPEVKEKLFSPFFTTKPAGEGTGLGLSISHDIIVKQHSGSIDVDTKPGEFAEFRIILPRTGVALIKSG